MKSLLTLSLIAAGLSLALPAGADTLKIATLAPKSSPWGKVFNTWSKAVKEKSGGRLELEFFYNGRQGDEAAMVRKMRSGQLDGAAITGVGLSKIYKPILALQMPGLFTNWRKLDRARDAVKGEFETGAREAGFQIIGWGDVGLVRTMSKGFAVQGPDDVQGKKPLVVPDDDNGAALMQAISGVRPVRVKVPEALSNLNDSALNLINAPCLAAEQLQWSSKVDHFTDMVIGVEIGGIVISARRLDSLPEDLRTIVLDTGRVATAALTTRIRSEDDAVCGRLKGEMTVTRPSADAQDQWNAKFRAARRALAQGTYPADLVERLEALAR
ncbi:MAG: TRAP transporter substrate-binding protein DctP [Myxococcales bacterium]|nr:TRAP transporter substrate-binding protein DctP [Myxococcales bacterium]